VIGLSFLYVTDNGGSIGIEGGKIKICHADGEFNCLPKECVQGISIFGKTQLTFQCLQYCMENDIPVGYFTQAGRYIGSVGGTYKTKTGRLRNQVHLSENEEFSLGLARSILHAKVNNQLVVAKRYLKGRKNEKNKLLFHLREARRKIPVETSVNKILGYEGIAAREYFSVLTNVIDDDFKFCKRSRKPPVDPFNCMISFGYSMLTKEIYGEIENRGMSAYIGFIHTDAEKHPALASDLVEEWRATIVDSVVLSLIQGHEIRKEMFTYEENHNCVMSREAMKILLTKLEKRMHTEMNYLTYLKRPVTFREALWYQADRLGKAIDKGDYTLYSPVYIR